VAEWGTWTYFKNADTGEADSTRYSAFFSQFYFNSKGDSLEIVMGQYPDVLVAGDVCTSEQYIVMGNKAVTINLKLNIVEKPVVTWDEMKDVGDYTIEQDKYYNDGYTATAIHLDMDDMAKKFGIDKSTLVAEGKLYAIDAGGGQSDKYTANGMGFWFDQNGMICTWGTSSRFAIEYHGDQAVMNLAFMPSVVNLNDEFAADLYLAHNASYVKIALKVKAIDKVKVTKPDVVATYPFEVQIVPSADSYNTSADFKSNQSVTLDLTEAAKAMGEDASTITSKLDLFGVSNAAGDITDVYNCDPNPAFWLKDTVTNWPNAPYGIIYANSGSTATFSFVQMPGLPKTGDVYTSKLYLVNRDKNEAVECRFTISFVDNMFTYQEVGSKDLSIALKPTDADTHKIAISLSDMATGFGIPSADLKAAGGSYPFTLYAMTETGAKTSTMTSEYGFWMTKDGNVCSQDNEACSFGLEYYGLSKAAEQDFDNIYVTVWGEVVDGDILTGKLYIGLPAVDGVVKLFTYNVVIYISNDPDGISTAKLGSKTDGNVYDLSGRLVRSKADSSQKLAKGIYILNNKKIAVK
jgi:hypothetical protein